ncbi:8504_t:CDS:1, partial [Cetraspora pellucida]
LNASRNKKKLGESLKLYFKKKNKEAKFAAIKKKVNSKNKNDDEILSEANRNNE